MKKCILTMLVLLCSVCINAADIKIGDVKYKVLKDGTVELKEFKTASGNVVIPEKIKDPKTSTEYTVSAIGKGVFKKTPVTSVTIPSTVTDLGQHAFDECTELTSVKLSGTITQIPAYCFRNCKSLKTLDMNFKDLTYVDYEAFDGCGIGTVTVVRYDIEGDKVRKNWGIVPNETKDFKAPIVIFPDADINAAAQFIQNQSEPLFIFIDENAGIQAFNVFEKFHSKYTYYVKGYFEHPDQHLNNSGKLSPLKDYMGTKVSYGMVTEPNFSAYFGADIKDGEIITKSPLQNMISSYEIAGENMRRKNFIDQYAQYTYLAINDPEKCLAFRFKDIPKIDWDKYRDIRLQSFELICDSAYFLKDKWSVPEMKVMVDIYNCYYGIVSSDYGTYTIQHWIDRDVVRKESESLKHKDMLDRIVKICKQIIDNRGVKAGERINPELHYDLFQALCAAGRWKEASDIYPEIYRTFDGYSELYIIEFLGKQIKEHGYKANKPVKKTTSKSNGSKSPDYTWINFIVDKAVDHYEQKQEEKRQRKQLIKAIQEANKK